MERNCKIICVRKSHISVEDTTGVAFSDIMSKYVLTRCQNSVILLLK